TLGIQVFDWKKMSFLNPSACVSRRHANIASFKRVTVADAATRAAALRSDGRKFRLKFEAGSRIRVYENRCSVPRAHVVHEAVFVTSEAEALKAIRDTAFNPWRQVVLEAARQDLPVSLPAPATGSGSFKDAVRIEGASVNDVLVRVNQSAPGLLVLADTYYPGWTARVDGRPVPILRANYLFRGVAVPAGSHRVEFHYVPLSF